MSNPNPRFTVVGVEQSVDAEFPWQIRFKDGKGEFAVTFKTLARCEEVSNYVKEYGDLPDFTLPEPCNPAHVHNLASIPLLKHQGFQGGDVSLATSLFEYNLVWRELPNGEILFVYPHPSIANKYDRCTIKSDTKVMDEYDWVHWAEFFNCLGCQESGERTKADWLAMPLPRQISDLLSYHNTEEIFGSSYWEGFSISEE